MRRDKYHDNVRVALEKEGWTITHDPYFIRLGKRKGFIIAQNSIEQWIK